MELTPIKVRGKRRTRRDEHLVVHPTKRFHKAPRQKNQARVRRPRASDVEKSLPLEVLERIFWLSENVNFPRASPRLGRLFSGLPTLRKTFINAFGPTWEVWFGCVRGRRRDFPVVQSYVGWDEDAHHFGGNAGFQTDLLACSWVTIDMILDCWDIWVRRHARNLPFEYFPFWGNPTCPVSYRGSDDTVGISRIKESRCYFYHDYDAFRNVEHHNAYSEHVEYRLARSPNTWIEVHGLTKIPDGLITGPWDEGSLQKFFWLVRAGARLSPDQTWEVTHEGFLNAISDQYAPNMTVIQLLHTLDAFKKWPRHLKGEEFDKIESIMPTLNYGEDAALPAMYTYIEYLLENDESSRIW